MGKLIRLTVTITITDTWTFSWMTEDDPPAQTATVVQDIVSQKSFVPHLPLRGPEGTPDKTFLDSYTAKEKQDEALQATLEEAAGQSNANDPMAQTPPPNDASARAKTRHQRNHTRGRRAADNPQSI